VRIRLAVPDAAMHPEVLDAALEAVTRTNERLLQSGQVPDADTAIASGVKWQPEPPGDEHFDHAATVVARGHGDCDDLAPYKAASLRHSGEDESAKAVVIRSGPNRWHAVVQRGDGSIDDPSADAGMYSYHAPVQPRLAGARGRAHIATKQVGSVWCARCDVPWKGSNHALSGHALAKNRAQAVADAIEGAVLVGDSACVVEPETLAKLATLHALLHGEDPERVHTALSSMGLKHAYQPMMQAVRSMGPLAHRLKTIRVHPSILRHWARDHGVSHFRAQTDPANYE